MSKLYYSSVDKWIENWFAQVFRRPCGPRRGYRWDEKWWANPEALVRLEALWRAWEVHRQDSGVGMADWLRIYADPTISILLAPEGPFAKADTICEITDPLKCHPAPQGMFQWLPSITEPEPRMLGQQLLSH